MVTLLKQAALTIIAVLTTAAGIYSLKDLPGALVALLILLTILFIVWKYWRDFAGINIQTLRKTDKFSVAHDHYFFVYGSLLVRDSLLRIVAQNPADMECIPAYLTGYKTQWGAFTRRKDFLDKNFHSLQSNMTWASLTAVKGNSQDRIPGAIIGVSNVGYVALRNREQHYDLKNVSKAIELQCENTELLNEKIMAFIPKPVDKENTIPNACFIRRQYFNGVNTALKRLGFYGLKKPKKIPLHNAFLINESIEKTLRTRHRKNILLKVHKTIANDLNVARETRSIAYALRPLVLPRLIFEEAKQVAGLLIPKC